jgi:prepilin-type N-terminal cleavage/methylation domain-containing protein
MKTTRRSDRRGLTLVELIISLSLFTFIAVWTMQLLAHGRVLQGRARDKADLVFQLQGHLDNLRNIPASLEPGTQSIQEPEGFPSGTTLTTTITDRDGLLELDVVAVRDSADGPIAARLTTLTRPPS